MREILKVILSFSILVSANSAIFAKPLPQSDASQRRLRLEDGFLAEDIKEPRFSPDGEALAAVRLRPVKDIRGYVLPIEGLRGDIWIQAAPGQPLKAITNGRADQAGYWELQWSPDSRQLAFLRAQGKTVTPWVWDREKNTVRQLSTRSVDHYDGEPCRWADSLRLICLVAKEGQTIPPAGGFAEEQYGEVAQKVWDKQARGEVTASALDSRFYDSPRGELLVIDTTSGESRFLSEAYLSRYPVVPFGDSPSMWWLAPGGRSVALLDPEPPILNAADGKDILSDVVWRRSFAIELRSIDGGQLKFSQPLPQGILPSSLQWSPDGQHLAFYTYDHTYRSRDEASLVPRLWLVSIPRRQAVGLDAGELRLASLLHQPWWEDDQDVPQMAPLFWTAGEAPQLLVRAGHKSAPAKLREEWWIVSDRHPPRAVSKAMPAVPQQWAVRTDTVLISLVEGEVWELQPRTARVRNLTAAFEPAITYLHPSADVKSPSHVLFGHGPHGSEFKRGMAGDWGKPVEQTVTYRLNLQTGRIERLKMPATEAGWADTELADYTRSKASIAYLQRNWNGTILWRIDGSDDQLQPLLTVNQFFRKIARPKTRWFNYVSSEGVKRRGWVMLPHGYVPGRSYPTVVTVRMGSLGFRREHNLLPHYPAIAYLGSLSAMGYLIFSPDFDEGYQYRTTEIDRAMVRAGNDIHSALDAVVAQGYADPDRFLIEGGSGTGKSALNLIAATHRFKAASVYAMGPLLGFTKLPPFTRYTDYAHAYVSREGRNYPGMRHSREEVHAGSLLSHIDLVQTPVLLAHGDLDPIPIDNSEEYFNSLVFHGKRAQFVRYWGETHCLGCASPANMADFTRRELAWFDEFADIARNTEGGIIWDGNRAKSRGGAVPLTPDDYSKFDFFASSRDSNDLVHPAQERDISAVVDRRE